MRRLLFLLVLPLGGCVYYNYAPRPYPPPYAYPAAPLTGWQPQPQQQSPPPEPSQPAPGGGNGPINLIPPPR